jgi:hypothetical protein
VEIVTNILSEEQFRQELRDAVSFLAQRGITNVTVSFGFTGAAPELEDAGVRYTIPIADVLLFIAERERTRGFRFGMIVGLRRWLLMRDFSSAMTAMSTSRRIPSSY